MTTTRAAATSEEATTTTAARAAIGTKIMSTATLAATAAKFQSQQLQQ